MRLYLVRHGSTDSREDVSLNESGRRQASLLSKAIDCDFSRVYCSDLKRSVETAKILDCGEPVIDDSLREYHEKFLVGDGTEEEKKQFLKLEKFIGMLHDNREDDETILIAGHAVMNKIIIAKLFGLELAKAIFLKQYYCNLTVLKWGSKLGKKAWRIETLNSTQHLPKELVGCIPNEI